MRYLCFLCSGIIMLVTLSLLSCANRQSYQSIPEAISSGHFKPYIKSLKEENTRSDIVLNLLNLGMMYRLDGDYQSSIRTWDQAKKAIAELRPTSVTETAASFLINDNSQSFIGSYQEQQWLHIFQALNYLDTNNPSGARVEMLQANQFHKEYAQGEIEPPFMRYLAGMVFESLGEEDQALVAYRKALDAYPKSNTATPRSLYIDAARMMQRLGIKDELEEVKQDNSISEADIMKSPNTTIIWLNGLVSEKQERIVAHWDSTSNLRFYVSLPFYPVDRSSAQISNLGTSDGKGLTFEAVANIDASIRAEFAKTENLLLTKTIARRLLKATIKNSLIESGDRESQLAGTAARAFVDVLEVLTESADLRSWNSLPYRVLLYRGHKPPGSEIELGGSTIATPLKVGHEKSTVFRSFFSLY